MTPEELAASKAHVKSVLDEVAAIPVFPIADIRRITTALIESPIREPEKAEHFFTIYEQFAKKYPMLYDTCCKNIVDRARLNFMLDMVEKVQANAIEKDKADVIVGQKLYDRYINIDPNVRPTSHRENK